MLAKLQVLSSENVEQEKGKEVEDVGWGPPAKDSSPAAFVHLFLYTDPLSPSFP